MTYKRGDVVQVNLGNVEEVRGREQANTRPCVIIKYLEFQNLAIIIPLSTHQNANLSYCSVEIEQRENGLNKKGYALCHQIRTISTERILRKFCELNEFEMAKIITTLSDFLEIE